MKPEATNREILLVMSSRFLQRSFCQKDCDDTRNATYSSMEELERACWDGMLNELLPELVGVPGCYNNNYIWNAVIGLRFLYISLGPSMVHVEHETSLDPYYFLSVLNYN